MTNTIVASAGKTSIQIGGGRKMTTYYPTVNVRDYGALGNGSDDDSDAFDSAIAALGAGGGTVRVPLGAYNFPYGQRVTVPPRVRILGESATMIGAGFSLSTCSRLERLSFAAQAGLTGFLGVPTDAVHTDMQIIDCVFTGRGAGYYDEGTNFYPTADGLACAKRLVMRGCAFSDFQTSCFNVDRLEDSIIEDSTFTAMAGGRSIYFKGGARNTIQRNTISGGATGIIFMFDPSFHNGHGELALQLDNQILDNIVSGVSEESISFDCCANSLTGTNAFEYDTINSVDGGTIVLNHAGWASSEVDYSGYDLVFVTGNARGRTATILSQDHATLTIDPAGLSFAAGDGVTIGAASRRNIIQGNTIAATVTGCPIMLYGMCFENVVDGNETTGTTGYSAINCQSVESPWVPTASVTQAKPRIPSCYNTISDNTIAEGQIWLDHWFGYEPEPTPFYSRGNAITGNTTPGGLTAKYQELYKSGNSFGAADSYDHVTEL